MVPSICAFSNSNPFNVEEFPRGEEYFLNKTEILHGSGVANHCYYVVIKLFSVWNITCKIIVSSFKLIYSIPFTQQF